MEANASNINTHFYKLAHLSTINYYTYTSSNDQQHTLLETELLIRHKYPRILIIYYRNEQEKYLYYFTFGHIDSLENNSGVDLEQQFLTIKLLNTNSVNIESLTSISKPNSDNNGEKQDNLMIIASCFLKSIKKMMIYNLSIKSFVKIFGNYCLIENTDDYSHRYYSILYVDPLLLPNGDLIISLMIKSHPKLFDSSIIGPINKQIDANFAIYIVPSGIRCHLFDPSLFTLNIVTNIDGSAQDTLINLIKLSIGIELTTENITWIKLVPNLKHLNSSTSSISKFIHLVENKKSILWPWELCCLQLGKFEQIPSIAEQNSIESNPIDLISNFLDFNISKNQSQNQIESKLDEHHTFPSIPSNKLDSAGPLNVASVDLNDLGTPLFNHQPVQELFDHNQSPIKIDFKPDNLPENNESSAKDDDMELDDLFGSNEVSDDNMDSTKDKTFDRSPLKEMDNHKNSELQSRVEMDSSDSHPTKTKDSMINYHAETESFKSSMPLTKSDAFKLTKKHIIDIPRDQMTIRKNTTPAYNDPGAPVPILFTPIIPQSIPSAVSTVPPSTAVEEAQPKSVFSPILFNPIIRSNIDTKYGKGGKFYVDKECTQDEDLEKKKKSIRATSVSGSEIFNFKDSGDQKNNMMANEAGIDDIEESFSSSEESDEDEEMEDEMRNLSPLKLYTATETFIHPHNSGPIGDDASRVGTANSVNLDEKSGQSGEKYNQSFKALGITISPNVNKNTGFRSDSPFYTNDLTQMGSPFDFELNNNQLTSLVQSPSQIQTKTQAPSHPIESNHVTDSKGMTEYLSLILRGISVNTLPNEFFVNNHMKDKLVPNFSIIDVENENDLELAKPKELVVSSKNINVLLKFLSANLIFDLGLNKIKNKTLFYVNESDNIIHDDSRFRLIDFKHIDPNFENSFLLLFPNSYKIKLQELLIDTKDFENSNSLDNQLDFLDEITSDYDLLNPTNQYKKLQSLHWDSIVPSATQSTSIKYREIMNQLTSTCKPSEENFFKLAPVKAKVLKNNEILNLNTVGLDFWKYLNFSPANGAKDFQILMVTEIDESGPSYAAEFLNQLTSSYSECNLGNISRVTLGSNDRMEMNIDNGLLLIRKEHGQTYTDVYNQIDGFLSLLIDAIKLDLIQKSNRFEFDRPLLLLFVNFNENMNSLLQITKIFRNFKENLTSHQLPLVKVFTKILPSTFLVKQKNCKSRLKILSNMTMGKLALNLYNQCHNGFVNKDVTRTLSTQLTKEPPTKIQFKFMNNKENNFEDDIFLHLAYERSIDTHWISAAWSDPNGIVTHSKSWYCGSNESDLKTNTADLGMIIEDIWNVCCDLFKRINDEMNNKTYGLGGKKFLVLTRVNSVIPEIELFHWKKLSLKHKDISLIVLSVNRSPKLVFNNNSIHRSSSVVFGTSDIPQQLSSDNPNNQTLNNQDKEAYFRPFGTSNNSSPNGLGMGSPNVINFHSPQNFLNVSGNIFSPLDIVSVGSGHSSGNNLNNEPELTLHDPSKDIVGVLPRVSLPSIASTNRSGSKIGYLMKEFVFENCQSHLVFEVCLLSCSNFWNSDTLLALILKHYNKLILLNDILGLRDLQGNIKVPTLKSNPIDEQSIQDYDYEIAGLIPWHIAAVSKAMDYLVHIYVEE